MRKYFVFGSLQSDQVCQVLINRVPTQKSARIEGYSRRCYSRGTFPGIIAEPKSSVNGKLIEITEKEEEIFDLFEGEDYEKIVVDVYVDEGGKERIERANLYISSALMLPYLNEEAWNYDNWREKHLKEFCVACKQFMKEKFSDLPFVKQY